MKYVLFRKKIGEGRGALVQLIPVIFPDVVTHALIAEALIASSPDFAGAEVVSAGDVNMTVYETAGKSESLGKRSRTVDRSIINQIDYMNYE